MNLVVCLSFVFVYILNKKERSHAYLKYVSRDVNAFLQILFYFLREVFTVLKMSITTKASKFMSKEQFDVKKGPNLKMQFKRAF